MTSETILVADNEPDILQFVSVNLRMEGYDVVLAADGEQALQHAFDVRPALVLLDVMMPKLDGLEVCRRLRADPRTSSTPIIMLTAKTMTADRVVGLTAGADDYVLKPFDPVELVARVRTTLRRSGDLRARSPLTGLPGNHLIIAEITRRMADREAVAVVYADLNDFKAYNDHYGFLRGDAVITLTAEILNDALTREGGREGFLGHIGGDDFVAVVAPEAVDAVCKHVVAEFDRRVRTLYDAEDLDRGYVEVPDRQGDQRRFPLVSISLGVATNEHRRFDDPRELVQVATEMKSFLKRRRDGSAYAVDGRRDARALPD